MVAKLTIDPGLIDYATPTQKKYAEAVIEHGSARAAAEALGVGKTSVTHAIATMKNEAARRGYAPGHWEAGVAPGYRMGKVTVQRGPNGVERTWERQSPDEAEAAARLLAMIAAAKEDLFPVQPLSTPLRCDDDLITIYPVGDPHAGLYSWKEETGTHFDLAEFERVNVAAIDRLVASTPCSRVAIFNDKGDSTHADNNKNRTPRSGHELDVDGRHSQVIRVSIRVKRHQINRLLEKHEQVIVRVDPGNHDPETALHLALILEALYEAEPRVTVITSPNSYWYYQFGRNLIGTCHGDGAKGKDLPGVMAHDAREWWGQAEYCVWFVGHVHHKDIKDYTGCTVEYMRTLAASDAHHHGAGYRARRTLEAVTLHRAGGEDERHTCHVHRLEPAA